MRSRTLAIILLFVGYATNIVAQSYNANDRILVAQTDNVLLSNAKGETTLQCRVNGVPIRAIWNEEEPVTIQMDDALFYLESGLLKTAEGAVKENSLNVGDVITLDFVRLGNYVARDVKAKVVSRQSCPLSINHSIFEGDATLQVTDDMMTINYNKEIEFGTTYTVNQVIIDSINHSIETFPEAVNQMRTYAPQLVDATGEEVVRLYDFCEGKITEHKMDIAAYRLDAKRIANPSEADVYIESYYPGVWSDFLLEHLDYPDKALQEDVQGRVMVEFIVEKDGSVSHAKVLKSLSEECDAEAVRVIKMSKWVPAKTIKGEPMRSRYIQSIRFEIMG